MLKIIYKIISWYWLFNKKVSDNTFCLLIAVDTSNVQHTQHIKIGTEGTITLGVTGSPKPTMTWKKEKTTLNAARDPRYTLLNDGSLRIKNVKIADQGNYTVNIQQGASSEEVKIEVYAVGTYAVFSIQLWLFNLHIHIETVSLERKTAFIRLFNNNWHADCSKKTSVMK